MDHVFLYLWAILQVSASFSSCVLTWGTRRFLFSQISSFPLSLPNTSSSSAYSQKFPLFPNCSLVEFSALSLLFFQSCISSKCIPCAESWQQLLGRPCTRGEERLSRCTGAVPNTSTAAQALQGEKKISSCLKSQTQELSEVAVSFWSPKKTFLQLEQASRKYPHLEKLVFHHIMYKQSHLENLQHSPDAGAPVCGEWRALLWTCNGQKCLTFHFKHQASEVLKIPLSGKTPPKSLASIPFLKWIAAINLH